MKTIALSLALLTMTACGTKALDGVINEGQATVFSKDTPTGSGAAAASGSTPNSVTATNAIPSAPSNSNFAPADSSEETVINDSIPDAGLPVSSPPVAIGGAYLRCVREVGGASCVASTARGPQDMAFIKAYVIQEDLMWDETTFRRTNIGTYHVDVPSEVTGSFAIGFSTTNRELLADWVVSPSSKVDLIRDGSFEGFNLPSDGTVFIDNNPKYPWFVALPTSNATCSKAVMEVTRNTTAENGRHVVDLNSTCTDIPGQVANAVLLSQTLSVKPNAFYEVIFHYAHHPSRSTASGVITRFGDVTVDQVTTVGNQWLERKFFSQTPNATTLILNFQDGQPDGSDNGVVFDDVRFLGFGKGPF